MDRRHGRSLHSYDGCRAKQLRWHTKEAEEEKAAQGSGAANMMHMESSHAIREWEKAKHTKYKPLIQRAQVQCQRHKRRNTPKFMVCAAAHRGEWSKDLYEIIEWLAAHKSRRIRDSDGDDGITPARAAGAFRTMLKDRLSVAMARGWGRQLVSTGYVI